MSLLLFFIVIQVFLLIVLVLHDWIHIPPLTDIRALEKVHSTKERLITAGINSVIVFIPLILTKLYPPELSRWVVVNIVIFYGLLTLGTICSWWIPYFFGSSEKYKKAFAEYRNTHHFLPARGDNVIPNTFHVLFIHIPTWICLMIAIYFLVR